MASFIDARYGHNFWSFVSEDHEHVNDDKTRISLQNAVTTPGEAINHLMGEQYGVFVQSELEWRLQTIMGNRKVDKRSAHRGKCLYSMQKRMDSVARWLRALAVPPLDLETLSDKEVTRKVKEIRESIETMDSVLKECQVLERNVIEHLIGFPSQWTRCIAPIRSKMATETGNGAMKNNVQRRRNHTVGTTLVYVLENEVHVDPELCDFNAFLHFHRYLLTVILEMKKRITTQYAPKLRSLLKRVGAEMVHSIWWRRRWEERQRFFFSVYSLHHIDCLESLPKLPKIPKLPKFQKIQK